MEATITTKKFAKLKKQVNLGALAVSRVLFLNNSESKHFFVSRKNFDLCLIDKKITYLHLQTIMAGKFEVNTHPIRVATTKQQRSTVLDLNRNLIL